MMLKLYSRSLQNQPQLHGQQDALHVQARPPYLELTLLGGVLQRLQLLLQYLYMPYTQYAVKKALVSEE